MARVIEGAVKYSESWGGAFCRRWLVVRLYQEMDACL